MPIDLNEINRTLGLILGKIDGLADDITEIKDNAKSSLAALDARVSANREDIEEHAQAMSRQAGFFGAIGLILGFVITAVMNWLSAHLFGGNST